MLTINATFVVLKYHKCGQAATMNNRGFFVAIFSRLYTLRGAITSFVKVKPLAACGLERKRLSIAPLLLFGLGSKRAIYIHNALNAQTNKMRNLENSLDFLRDSVKTAPDLIRTKRLLHEVFTTFYLSDSFTDSHDDRKQDIAFLAVMLTDLLDDLFLQNFQNPIQKPCNN